MEINDISRQHDSLGKWDFYGWVSDNNITPEQVEEATGITADVVAMRLRDLERMG